MAALVRWTFVGGLGLVALSTQAAVIYDINLYNASGHSVELLIKSSSRIWAMIPPGHSKAFAYYSGVSLRCSGRQLDYRRVDPPSDYISTGLFSTSFKAQLTPDFQIYLLPPSASPPVAQFPRQPKGFPLSPVTNRSNQSMKPVSSLKAS
jgi:hypothetical protein